MGGPDGPYSPTGCSEDWIFGHDGDDYICGCGGADILYGMGGNDWIGDSNNNPNYKTEIHGLWGMDTLCSYGGVWGGMSCDAANGDGCVLLYGEDDFDICITDDYTNTCVSEDPTKEFYCEECSVQPEGRCYEELYVPGDFDCEGCI